jgi:dsDNA-binding SOS-regulon protein
MTVKTKYFSDKDISTMFDDKAKADAYDRKLENIENLAMVLMDSAKTSSMVLDEDNAYKMAETMLDEHNEQLTAIITGKKPRKSRPPVTTDSDTEKDRSNEQAA